MTKSPGTSRISSRFPITLGLVLVLAGSVVLPHPATAIDLFGRESEADLSLRDPRRVRGLQLTVEMRFLTVDDEFLERVGVDLSGAVNGRASRRGEGVENAKIIVEAFAVRNVGTPPRRTTARTGRVAVKTDASGEFRVPLRDLIDTDTRAEILDGKIVSLVASATGKNGKRVDLLRVRLSTMMGGLVP